MRRWLRLWLLLDSRALIWWPVDSRRPPTRARHAVVHHRANENLISTATAWEIVSKHRLDTPPEADILPLDVTGVMMR